MTTTTPAAGVLSGGTSIEHREETLAAGADELTRARRSRWEDPRVLPRLAAAMMTTGVTVILLGWFGAAQSTLVEEQIPYLISGGLLGLALSVIGALLFFGHWQNVSIREARQREQTRRRDHAELMAALHALAARRGDVVPEHGEEESDGRARGTRAGRPLRRTSGG